MHLSLTKKVLLETPQQIWLLKPLLDRSQCLAAISLPPASSLPPTADGVFGSFLCPLLGILFGTSFNKAFTTQGAFLDRHNTDNLESEQQALFVFGLVCFGCNISLILCSLTAPARFPRVPAGSYINQKLTTAVCCGPPRDYFLNLPHIPLGAEQMPHQHAIPDRSFLCLQTVPFKLISKSVMEYRTDSKVPL